MELAIETVQNKIERFLRQLKWLNPTVIAFSVTDLLLGLLAISMIDLAATAVLASLTSVSLILAVYAKFKSLKKQAEKLGIYADKLFALSKYYNVSALVWGLLDVIFGSIAIVATSIAFLSTLSSVAKLKVVSLGSKFINLQKIQSTLQTIGKSGKLKNTFQIAGLSGIVYIVSRGQKFLKGVKTMFKKLFATLNSNKLSTLLSGTAVAVSADAMLGSPILMDILALFNIVECPIWLKSVVYGLILLLSVAGIKWENIEAYGKRISEKKEFKLAQAVLKAQAKKKQENLEKAKALLAEKQSKELEALASQIAERENETPVVLQ
jgi:signal transduction histidine kinase